MAGLTTAQSRLEGSEVIKLELHQLSIITYSDLATAQSTVTTQLFLLEQYILSDMKEGPTVGLKY